jgi:hypothetical protein
MAIRLQSAVAWSSHCRDRTAKEGICRNLWRERELHPVMSQTLAKLFEALFGYTDFH